MYIYIFKTLSILIIECKSRIGPTKYRMCNVYNIFSKFHMRETCEMTHDVNGFFAVGQFAVRKNVSFG